MTEIMTAEAQQAPGPAAEQASGAVPPIVDRPCRHYGPNALSWPEHPELESFMRATYEPSVRTSYHTREVGILPVVALPARLEEDSDAEVHDALAVPFAAPTESWSRASPAEVS